MTALIGALLRWVGRNLLSLAAITLILYLGALASARWSEYRDYQTRIAGLETAAAALRKYSGEAAAAAEQQVRTARQAPSARIEQRIRELPAEIGRKRAVQRSLDKPSLLRPDAAGFITYRRLDMEIALLEYELGQLRALSGQRELANARREHARAYAALVANSGAKPFCYPDATDLQARLEARISTAARRHNELCQRNAAAWRAFQTLDRQVLLLARPAAALASTARSYRDIEEKIAATTRAMDASPVASVLRNILAFLPQAMLVLAGVLLLPLAIKIFLYYVIAPLASRRPPIRIMPQAGRRAGQTDVTGPAELPFAGSAVSQSIILGSRHELLVHPEYLQSSGVNSPADTQWFFSYRYPLTSLAAGLVALTRFRPLDPECVVVSSTRDPFSEIAVLDLAAGAAIVMQPHCLVGILQDRAMPLRITSHWRLASLSGWLTLQFRYLVFHGPGKLLLKGCRGIRVEPAAAGRRINQAATMGFSAGLDYSTARCETFAAYALGKQELFNDSFSGGPGFCVYEEMPHFGKKTGIAGRGIEGLMDSLMKVFGI